jgi:ABC-2 type transport system permease protein
MKLLRDTWLVFQRAFGQTVRNPAWTITLLFQPIMFLYLFGPLLKNSLRGVPTDQAFNIFVPGLMVQIALFGTLFVGFGLVAEIRDGVIERFRVTPLSRFSLLAGRSLRDAVVLMFQGLLLMVLAIPLGLHVNGWGLVEMLGIMALIGLCFAPLSYALAMLLKDENALGPITNMLSLPLLLLSGILIPMSYAPRWLRDVSRINPLTHVVDGARDLFAGHLWNGTVGLALLLSSVLAAVMLTLAGRLFHRSAA